MAKKEEKKEVQEIKEEVAQVETKETVELSKEELEALLQKARTSAQQEMALAQAKENAKKALEEEAKAKREEILNMESTRQILNNQKKFKCVIYAPEGESNVKGSSLSINGVEYKFEYGKELILPEAAIELLQNCKTFGTPKVIDGIDEYGNKCKTLAPNKIEKFKVSARPA